MPNNVLDFIQIMVKTRETFSKKMEGVEYICFEDFVLRNGKAHTPQDLPRIYNHHKGEMKLCFMNSALAALEDDTLTYVEGYAWAGTIPVHHAWCIDKNRSVVDLTWDDGLEYFGVEFNTPYVKEVVLNSKHYGIIGNFTQGFPLLTGEHSIQRAKKVWDT